MIHFPDENEETRYAWNLGITTNNKGEFLKLWKELDITKNKSIYIYVYIYYW